MKPGSTCGQLVHQADIMATIAEIIGVDLPENGGEDSFSLLPLLKGKERSVRLNAISCSIRGIPSIRLGEWKLILDSGSGGWTKGESDQKVQLYRLDKDPGETSNLASKYPEKVDEMKKLLEKLIEDGRSTAGKMQQNDVDVVRYQ
ncbi:MAG: hypothetical protein ACK5M7_12550 [Draconibacterium sp.]